MIKFKFNSGMLAILCSKCSRILKVGSDFTEQEKAAMNGESYLPAKYCLGCTPIKPKDMRNEYDILLKSGLFFEFYPELCGLWDTDKEQWRKIYKQLKIIRNK